MEQSGVLDAATGELIWRFDPEVPPEWGGNSCCGVGSRGLAAWEGKIIIATLDGRENRPAGTPIPQPGSGLIGADPARRKLRRTGTLGRRRTGD